MRATPTLSVTSGTNYYNFYIAGVDKQVNSVSALGSTTNYTSISGLTSGLTTGQAGVLYISNNAASISYSAEL
jgi:phage-related baseplate assembly protein